MRFPIARLAVGVLCLILPAQAQNQSTLSGLLTDPSGAAVSRAEVVAEPRPGGSGLAERTTTGNDGRYSLALSPGTYAVRVVHASFVRAELEVTLAAGETREWSPRLELERLSATVIVSAQAEPAIAETVSLPVATFTREDIERGNVPFLGQLLAAAPGLDVARTGREGAPTSLFTNGGNSNFTKVLVDGVPLNEPGGAIDLSNFALDNLEKVEVVRGAESALFGSDAMSGVVQVFTRRGSTTRPLFTLTGEGGSFSTGRGSAQLSGIAGWFDYSAGAAHFLTEGEGVNENFRNTTLSGNFGFRIAENHRLRVSLRSNSSDAGIAGQTLLQPPNLDQHNALRNFTANLGWEFSTGPRWRHRLAGGETYIRQLFDNPTSDFCQTAPPFLCDFAFTVRNHYNRAGVSHQSSYVAPRGGVTFGYQLEVENGSFSGTHGHRDNQAGFVEGRWQAGHRTTLVGGFRVEGNQSFGTRAVPRFGVNYLARFGDENFGATRLRFSYGEGIKEPSLSQSFAQDPCFPGNPDLRPEKNRSFNVGADQMLVRDRVRISADGFFNRFRDITSFTFCFPGGPCPVPPPPGCTFGFGTFFNTDLARANGATLAVEAKAVSWLRLGGNYTYLDSRVIDAPNAFDPALAPGSRLFRRPVHSGNVAVNADLWRTHWSLVARFVGQRTDSDFLGLGLTSNPGYARVDLAGTYNLRREVEVFGSIENLFDKEYQETLGFPALPRRLRMGVRFLLGGE